MKKFNKNIYYFVIRKINILISYFTIYNIYNIHVQSEFQRSFIELILIHRMILEIEKLIAYIIFSNRK